MSKRLIAAFILGVIMGSAFTTVITAQRIEHLWRQRQELMFMLADQESRIRILTDSLEKREDSPVEKFAVTMQGVDEMDELQMGQRLRALLEPLIGKPVESLDGEMLYRLLDGQIVEVNRKWYQIRPKVIIIAPTVGVLVEGRQIRPD
jgi:hypothetical protein